MNWPCELCGAWQGQGLCDACLQRFAGQGMARCPRCALASPGGRLCGACLRTPPPFDRCIVAVDYAFPWDRLVARFKFEQHAELAGLFARVLSRVLLPADVAGVDAIVPVPLSRQRLAERGYNQAWELARRLGRATGLPVHAQALTRLRDTAHQVGSQRAQREANLRHALWMTPESSARWAGRRVALVDDVVTTGATTTAAASVLLAAGVAQVQVWALARTPAPER